jgi:hypothetical protein
MPARFFTRPPYQNAEFDVLPKELPQTPTLEVAGDCRIAEFEIVNTSEIAATFWLYDGQNPGICIVPATLLHPGESSSGAFHRGRPMPGGIVWYASGPGLHGCIRGDVGL